jgi:hypothetical protein
VERTAKTVGDVVSEAAEVLKNAVNASKNSAEEEEKPKTDE